jgi:cytochrome P450
MLFVMTNPRVYVRLQTEVDNYLKTSNLPRDQIIPSKDAETLPYLQAVIREGLRIWPPVTGMLPKKTPPEGDTINGIFIPGGTDIGYCAWGVHRNRDVFGSDSELFRPERWLEAKGEKLAVMERTIDLVFGHGKYQCLGQNIAWMELNKMFFGLIRHFEWSIIDPTNPWKSGNVGLWLQKDLWVRVSEREKGSS